MGRFRSLIRRSVRPLAMLAVVGAVSLSLIVATPSTAQALVAPPVSPPVIAGAVKTAAPALLAGAVRLHPVGFVISNLAAVGMMLYDTRESWVPMVTGTFGAAEGGTPAPTAGTQPTNPNSSLGALYKHSTSESVVTTMTFSGSGNAQIAWTVSTFCKRQDGTTYKVNYGAGPTMVNGAGDFYPKSRAFVASGCGAGHTLQGAVAGRYGSDPRLSQTPESIQGPNNLVEYGNQQTSGIPAFDPKSPETKYTVKQECISDGGVKSTVEATSTGDMGAIKFPSCAAAGKGHGTGVTTITGLRPGGQPGVDEKILWDIPTAPMDPATPLCDPGRAGSGCTLEVTKDGKPCTTGDPECENWHEESGKEDQKARYGCKLGPYTLPMSACSLLSKAYFPGGAPATEENVDADPKTGNPLDPNGNPVPVNTPTTTGVTPGAPGAPSPSADTGTKQCWPSGWGWFNPSEWVLKPLRCAFEPSTNLQTRVTGWSDKAEGKAPISFLNMDMLGPSGGGCPNWVVNVPGFSQNVVCGSSYTAAILSVRGPLFAIVATAMVWPLLRSLWYAAIPVLRVTPTGGK